MHERKNEDVQYPLLFSSGDVLGSGGYKLCLYVNHGKEVNFAKGCTGGSASWACLCILAGLYCDKAEVETLPLFGVILTLVIALAAFSMPWKAISRKHYIYNKKKEEKPHSVWYLVKNYPAYTLFLCGSAVMFMGYNFGSAFLIDVFTRLGGNNMHYGLAEFVLAMSEIPSAFIILKCRKQIPMKWMMLCCAVFMTFKNLIPAYAQNLPVVILAQAYEMLGFGLFYAGGMYFIEEMLPRKELVKATTLISVATIGSGEGTASFLCGVVREHAGLLGLMRVGTLVNAAAIGIMLLMCCMRVEKNVTVHTSLECSQ